MNTEILGSVLQVVLLVVLAYPLGRYIAKVYKGERVWTDFMAPVERWMFKLSGKPGRVNELEEILGGIVDDQPVLVLLGNVPSGLPRASAVEPGWECGTNTRSGVQHLYQFHGKL